MKVNKKLAPFLTKHKPIKVAIGGRGSGKSIGFGDMLTFKMDTERCDIYCLREFQDSISDSVHKVFSSSIKKRLNLDGWEIQKNCVISPFGNQTTYKGANRNPDAMQSAQDYKYSWFEEAHRASQDSIDKLLPTIIRNPGAECWFSANPQSSNDPFSQRFITPYLHDLENSGYYEDELHLVVVVNWRDNPWWNDEQEVLRLWDYENLPRAKYDWIWEGKFHDSVEDALILPEWFDACVDAHVNLGFKPEGVKYCAHDPSDEGSDSKGFAYKHGSVVLDVQEKTTGNVNDGCDWALAKSLDLMCDAFTYDGDGMGLALGRDISKAFKGKHTKIEIFRGSEGVDRPEEIYQHADSVYHQKKNKEAFKNKRAQYYFMLRDSIYKTYRAVIHKEYHNPDDLISFSSKIKLLQKLRSELCRIPVKPNVSGKFELYTKEVMKNQFKISSPNLADCIMMLRRTPTFSTISKPVMPRPIPTMGIR